MKTKIVALAALLALGLVACNDTDATSSSNPDESSSSSQSSSSSESEQTTYTAVTIANKADFENPLYVEEPTGTPLTIQTTPTANPQTLFAEGRLKVTASTPGIVSISNAMLTPAGVGTTTVTVTLTNPDGTSLTDSVDVTVTNRPLDPVGPVALEEIEAGTYYLGYGQGKEARFATGNYSTYYGETVNNFTNMDAAAEFEVASSGEGWTIKVATEGLENTGKYVAAVQDGRFIDFEFANEPCVFTLKDGYFTVAIDGADYALANDGEHDTLSIEKLGGETTPVAVNLYNWYEGYLAVGEPVSGQTYKFGADVEGNPNNAQCITGDMVNTYYLGTIADPEYAIDVTVTKETNGWTLKLENGKYIGVTVSGTHINAVYQDDPYYFDYSTEYGTFIGNEEYDGAATDIIIGLQGTYATMGAYAISEIEDTYVAHLYDGYYIPSEEVVMTEGPIWTAPADGLTAKFGVYNDSAANNGYWMITGEMDGFYFGLVKTTEKSEYDGAANVTAHAVANKENVYTLQLDNGKYIGAAGGDHANILFVDDAYEWTYDVERQIFTTTLTVGEYDPELYFIGGQKHFDTLSLSRETFYADNTHAGFFTWGEYDTETPDPDPAPAFPAKETAVETTVGAILDGTTAAANTLYKVSGIVEGRDYDNAYGNAYLTDPTTGESIALYGLVTHYDAFYINDEGEYDLKNPATSDEDLKDVPNGSNVTVIGYWTTWAKNLSAYLDSHTTNTDTYDVEINAGEHGSATLSAETATYGTEITVTVTPESGYRTDKVTVTTAYGTENLTAEEDGTYKFTATCVNEVTVTFADTSVVATSFEITAEAIGVGGGYGNGSGNINVNGTQVAISFNQLTTKGSSIQTNDNRDPNSQLWNTVAVPGTITSIAVTFTEFEASDAESTGIGVANEAYSAISATDAATQLTSLSTGTVEGSTVTVEFAEGGSYFTIARIDGGNAAYIASIVVNFTPAA